MVVSMPTFVSFDIFKMLDLLLFDYLFTILNNPKYKKFIDQRKFYMFL